MHADADYGQMWLVLYEQLVRYKQYVQGASYPSVYPLEFSDVPFQVEDQRAGVCLKTGAQNKFMNEIPQEDGGAAYELSDTGYLDKLAAQQQGQVVTLGTTYIYSANGQRSSKIPLWLDTWTSCAP
jgi:alpha-D-ribose 1-methylphosphonate 5-phosphate C-P lyase